MKIVGVRNAHTHQDFNPKIRIEYSIEVGELKVYFQSETSVVVENSAADPDFVPADGMEPTTSGSHEVIRNSEDSAILNIGELRARFDWCDHQTYFLAVQEGKFVTVFALYPETLPNRETARDYAQRLQRNLIVGINVPFAGATDDELFITVNVNANAADTDITVNEHCTLEWSDAASSGAVRTMLFPHIRVIAPATIEAGGNATIQLRIEDIAENLLDCTATVYVEAVTGAVPATRIPAKNGLVSVPVSAFGLVAGDEVRIKFGWKYFPGADEARIAVV
jgi:hypothetical protein